MSTAERLLERLRRVRPMGQGRWTACCPAHDDKSPSLAIRETSDGTVLLKCFAGCTVTDIVMEVGMTVAELFPQRAGHSRPSERRPFDPMQVLIAVAHEALTVAIVAEDLYRSGSVTEQNRHRLEVACGRILQALSAIGELPEPPELKRLRRGEYLVVAVE